MKSVAIIFFIMCVVWTGEAEKTCENISIEINQIMRNDTLNSTMKSVAMANELINTDILKNFQNLLNFTCYSKNIPNVVVLASIEITGKGDENLYELCIKVIIAVTGSTVEEEITAIEDLIKHAYKSFPNTSTPPLYINGVELVFLNGNNQTNHTRKTKRFGLFHVEVPKNDWPVALYLYKNSRFPTSKNSKIKSDEYPFVYISKSILGIIYFDENRDVVGKTANFTADFSTDNTLSVIHPLTRLSGYKIHCGFFDPNKKSWDTTGCSTMTVNLRCRRCHCNHTTSFALLFAVRPLKFESPWPEISYAFQIASIVFLAVTAIMVFINRRKLRHFNRCLVQINICVALFLFHLCSVLEKQVLGYYYLCRVMAALIQTFVIASALLMVFEGVLMLLTISGSFTAVHGEVMRRRRIPVFVTVWVAPIIYSAITALVLSIRNEYIYKDVVTKRTTSCIISHEKNFLVLIPVCIALSVNMFVVFRLGYLVWQMSKGTKKFKPSDASEDNTFHAARAMRAVLSLMTLLGIPWIFGYLINVEEYYLEKIFLAIHFIFNGLQGVLVFIHYVLLNSEMRGAVAQSWKSAMSGKDTLISVLFTSKKEDTVELHGI